MDIKYMGHAFNIVYIDKQPYFIDNTLLSKRGKICNESFMLASTETFSETHGEFVEVAKHNCPSDYDRSAIYIAEIWAERYLLTYTKEEISYLQQIGLSVIANKARVSKDNSSSAPKF